MNLFDLFLEQWSFALGQTMILSLLKALPIGVALVLLPRLLPALASRGRQIVACYLGLLVMLGLSIADFLRLWRDSAITSNVAPAAVSFASSHVGPLPAMGVSNQWLALPDEAFLLLSFFWLLGFVVFSMRFLLGWRFLARLRNQEEQAGPLDGYLEQWSLTLGLKSTPRLFLAPSGNSLFSYGWIRPLIVLPATVMGLPREQLELVLF